MTYQQRLSNYEADKAAWIAKNPAASSSQYEVAIRAIADKWCI